MTKIQVHIEIAGHTQHAAELFTTNRRGRLTSTLHFTPEYLSTPLAYSPEPAWQLTSGAWPADGALPRCFTDASPDRWGRNLITKRHLATAGSSATRQLTELDYLLGVSDLTRQGALRFSTSLGTDFLAPGNQVPKLIELPRLVAAADLVARDDDQDDQAVKELLDAGTGSLGGARPKASVRDEHGLYVAKFGHHHDEWSVMAWEATTLELARRAGLTVPEFSLRQVGAAPVLLLRRFDRAGSQRIGYLSALTLLEANDGDRGDYLDLADRITEVSPRAAADLQELWARVLFSAVLNNTDDHLRNHGFLRQKTGWVLAPLFDVNPNPDVAAHRVTSLAGQTTGAQTIKALWESADIFNVSAERAVKIIAQMATAVSQWQAVATHYGVPQQEFPRFKPVFEAGSHLLDDIIH